MYIKDILQKSKEDVNEARKITPNDEVLLPEGIFELISSIQTVITHPNLSVCARIFLVCVKRGNNKLNKRVFCFFLDILCIVAHVYI